MSRENRLILGWMIIFVTAIAILSRRYPWVLGVGLAGMYLLGAILICCFHVRFRRGAAAVRNALAVKGQVGILEVSSSTELSAWITKRFTDTLQGISFVRSLLRLVEQLPLTLTAVSSQAKTPLFEVSVKMDRARMQQLLFGRVRELQQQMAEARIEG
jgi:hypothetical protein